MSEALKWRIEDRGFGKAHFYVECDVGGSDQGRGVPECVRSLWMQAASHPMWQWDGNKDAPTITPSIACAQDGCKRHFTMVKGVPQ